MALINCPECKNEIAAGARFCSNCGCDVELAKRAYFGGNNCDTLIVHGGKSQSLDGKFVIFDTETTGLDPEYDRLTQIAGLVFSGGRIYSSFDTMVDPERLIPRNITELTGISNDMVEVAPLEDEALQRFLEFANGAVLVAHNANFHVSFLKAAAKRSNIEFDCTFIDTLSLAKALYQDLSGYSLKKLAEHFEIEDCSNPSKAQSDALKVHGIFVKMIDNLKNKYDINDIGEINSKLLGYSVPDSSAPQPTKFGNWTEEKMALINCPECKAEIADGARFCTNCGCEIDAIRGGDIAKKPVNDKKMALINCPKCKVEIACGARFCPSCGCNVSEINSKLVGESVSDSATPQPTRSGNWTEGKMALINCPECKAEIVDGARFCPNCGCALNAIRGGNIVKKPVKKKSFAFVFSAVEGTLLYDAGMTSVKMILAAEEIEFRDAANIFGRKKPVYLSYSQVRNFGFVEQRQNVRKDKSVVGRAVVGGLLFGSLGAIVGAIDGTGKKVEKEKKEFFIIDYISQNGERGFLSLDCCLLWPWKRKKLSTLLNERCPNLVKEGCPDFVNVALPGDRL